MLLFDTISNKLCKLHNLLYSLNYNFTYNNKTSYNNHNKKKKKIKNNIYHKFIK